MRANFEFIDKLGVDLWCFHDRDIAPDGKTLEVSNLPCLYMSHSPINVGFCVSRSKIWEKGYEM